MQAPRSPKRLLTSSRLCGIRSQKLVLFEFKRIIIIIIIIGSGGMVVENRSNFCWVRRISFWYQTFLVGAQNHC
jgi:hypothetical protein